MNESPSAVPFNRHWTITEIRRGKKEDDRDHLIYAELRDSENELVISATLDYILERVREMTLFTLKP